jgi:nitrous oxidase accessory protein NosD
MHSPDNVVVGNRLTGNDVGVDVFAADSIDNSIYHNSFVGNVIQAGVYSSYNSWYSGYPSWDSGYPSGGNYWSDYNGSDLYGGPYQNVTGSDGIGDAPYIINALISTDHYPLMSPVKKIVGDVNMDGVVDGRDLIVVSRAFAATPACTNWNQLADLNGDGKIDGQDMIIVARHFGQHYL